MDRVAPRCDEWEQCRDGKKLCECLAERIALMDEGCARPASGGNTDRPND